MSADSVNSDTSITVYRLEACPFCERVIRLLEDLDLSYHSRFVEPMHSDRDVVKRISGKRTVPALIDGNTGVIMSESGNIVTYLEQTYGPNSETSTEKPMEEV
ncbi:glutathione S-transferase N-terminal domain-containing protein [Haloquadratum walsbyi]|jgi:Glutathione S-transferase|uniref:Glutathione S-transferase n=1 Tax=Haloquadratum walsbyi J07HQW2 TaxID=1238425 RepID=U1NFN3_9EURY|nr:glutathione S-transferase N-terminal domain-containing protein [Haloquadratum walsbyi]ERG95885.1 MAG: glutathione S-transferase [Haloquadratum walsbyi J07HQW2]